jgi:hypothetical protein
MWTFVVIIEQAEGYLPFIVFSHVLLGLYKVSQTCLSSSSRIKSVETSPEMNFFIAAYHSVFLYDEVNTRSLTFTKPPSRHDVGSRLKWNVTTADSVRRFTGKEIDDTSTPSTTHAGMNDVLHMEKVCFQPVIHEEASTYRRR